MSLLCITGIMRLRVKEATKVLHENERIPYTEEERQVMDGVLYDICPDCQNDEKVFCPRNVDGICIECGIRLCAAHLLKHFKEIHCISLDLEHCSA